MALDVRQDHLAIIRAILKNIIPNYDVKAFGSRTQGTAKKTSDLDLCVMTETPLLFDTKIKLRTAFSESDIPYRVDIVDWEKEYRFTYKKIKPEDLKDNHPLTISITPQMLIQKIYLKKNHGLLEEELAELRKDFEVHET